MSSLEGLLKFLDQLRAAKVQYRLESVRDAVMVVIPAPSKYYEVEFFDDGHVEIQTFGPQGPVTSSTLDEVLERIVRDVNG